MMTVKKLMIGCNNDGHDSVGGEDYHTDDKNGDDDIMEKTIMSFLTKWIDDNKKNKYHHKHHVAGENNNGDQDGSGESCGGGDGSYYFIFFVKIDEKIFLDTIHTDRRLLYNLWQIQKFLRNSISSSFSMFTKHSVGQWNINQRPKRYLETQQMLRLRHTLVTRELVVIGNS